MPITGRTLGEAARKFRDAVNHVLPRTVTRTPVVLVDKEGGQFFQVAFRQAGQPIKAILNTHFGLLGFYFFQVCGSFIRPEDKSHQLFTRNYTYALYPEDSDEPIIRWEYIKEPEPEQLWCRHHVQGPMELQLNRHQISLDDIHLPTGYVTFEEVIRFCIVDLGVQPLDENWHEILVESYEQFKVDFVQRR